MNTDTKPQAGVLSDEDCHAIYMKSIQLRGFDIYRLCREVEAEVLRRAALTSGASQPEPAVIGPMPTRGFIPWVDLRALVAEAQMGVRDERYCDAKPDQGHQEVRMNWNSLNRIVSTFAAPQAGASQQAAPEGWKLVPIEPTDIMVSNGQEQHECEQGDSYYPNRELSEDDCRQIWKAMLAAAPQTEPADPAPCKGENCGSADPTRHSPECIAEHDRITTAVDPVRPKAINVMDQILADQLARPRPIRLPTATPPAAQGAERDVARDRYERFVTANGPLTDWQFFLAGWQGKGVYAAAQGADERAAGEPGVHEAQPTATLPDAADGGRA